MGDSGRLAPALAVAVKAVAGRKVKSASRLQAVGGSRERGGLVGGDGIDVSGWRATVARSSRGDKCTCGGGMQIRPRAADGNGVLWS